MGSIKKDHKSGNVNFWIVKYVADGCLTNIKKKKKSRPKVQKSIVCKKLHFEENNFEIYELIFEEKFILKHFMYRTIPKRCVLGVLWTTQYVSKVYFTWRRLRVTLLTSFYGCNAFGCIYILLALKNKNISIHQLLYFGDMFWNVISLDFCKKPRNVHFDPNSVFSFSCFVDFWSLHGAHLMCVYSWMYVRKCYKFLKYSDLHLICPNYFFIIILLLFSCYHWISFKFPKFLGISLTCQKIDTNHLLSIIDKMNLKSI